MADEQKSVISIIVPIYKAEKYLEKCLASIQSQTYRNLQILLIDDGSPDACGEICEEYAKKDQRIQVIHQENSGVSSARNTGLREAAGDFVAFVDPDDYISEDMIETLYIEAVESGSDIVACCAMIITDKGLVENSFFSQQEVEGTLVAKETAILQLVSNRIFSGAGRFIDIGVPWGKLYKRSLISSNGLKFNVDLRRMQDNIFNLYAFQYANRISYLDEPLYFYNTTNTQQEFNKYVEDADTLFKNLAFETEAFLEKYEWQLKQDFQQAYALKATLFLLSILNSKIFHEKYEASTEKKLNEARELVLMEPFHSSLKKVDTGYFRIHNKLLISLLNRNLLYPACRLVMMKNSIKEQRSKKVVLAGTGQPKA